MSLIDAVIPFAVGMLLALRPQMFVKAGGAQEESRIKRNRLRKIGYLLIGVAAVYAVIALVESRGWG